MSNDIAPTKPQDDKNTYIVVNVEKRNTVMSTFISLVIIAWIVAGICPSNCFCVFRRKWLLAKYIWTFNRNFIRSDVFCLFIPYEGFWILLLWKIVRNSTMKISIKRIENLVCYTLNKFH